MAHQTRVSIVNERTASHNPVVTELKSNGLATFNSKRQIKQCIEK